MQGGFACAGSSAVEAFVAGLDWYRSAPAPFALLDTAAEPSVHGQNAGVALWLWGAAEAVKHTTRTLSGPPSTGAAIAMDGGVADTACNYTGRLIGGGRGKG
jgi:hypothetical protein